VKRHDPGRTRHASRFLRRFAFLNLSDAVVSAAGTIDPSTLRTLDAIHIASALALQESLEALITYDRRMREAAEALGLPVEAPA
jgi:predicted nucleic acid-binding protein